MDRHKPKEGKCCICGKKFIRKRIRSIPSRTICSKKSSCLGVLLAHLQSGNDDSLMPKGRKQEITGHWGYRFVYKPEHPRANRDGYVKKANVIAEKKLGRFLKNDEVVHHINFIKTDDSPKNLMVMSDSEHKRFHATHRHRELKK